MPNDRKRESSFQSLLLQNGQNDAASSKRVKRETKRVVFALNLETIHWYEGSEERDDNVEDTQGTTSVAGIRTEEITVLSSLHGQARRKLREISKLTLKQAVKYGTKERTRNDPKTGLPRWKFTFGNVVYITDHTCRVEVTCFREPLDIQEAPITPAMEESHAKNCHILKNNPLLCTSHTYVILDQSGSMRTCDVPGFRNRSQAAFGCLALDYVSQQLCSQPIDQPGADSFTLIEMNATGTETISQVPIDWILFNTLVRRQKQAKPKSHGNYLDSILKARELIEQQINSLGVLDYAEYPPFVLVFLSDGIPSDMDKEGDWLEEVSDLCARLKTKLSILCMTAGPQDNEHSRAMQNIIETAKNYGCETHLIHAGVSAEGLTGGFSSACRTVTTARSTVLSKDEPSAEEIPHEVVKLSRRESMEKSQQDCVLHLDTVQRFRLLFDKWQQDSDSKKCWRATSFATFGASGFTKDSIPFGKGVERLAFRLQEITHDQQLVGKVLVAKQCLRAMTHNQKERFHKECVGTQLTAMQLAKKFNDTTEKNPHFRAKESDMKNFPKIRFIQCYVYKYLDKDSIQQSLLVEQMLHGKYTKFTGNNGYVRESPCGPKIELMCGTIQCSDVLHAFSHWTFFNSKHKLLVCDLQGVLNTEGPVPRLELTDPAICSHHSGKRSRFGITDVGVKGMRNFSRTHQCNLVCKFLGLPPV
eukprot:Nitzschia sp. Nitz4//scaffold209_size42451//23717//25822//NITZ4_007359-RA/size42451-processed-gene-0.62-mRNA-1//1//CDS//3329541703//4160//frame0